MHQTFRCDDKETLVAYLYGEIDDDARRRVADHLRACDACSGELDALGGVRRELAEWQPPAPALDFQIVQQPRVLRPSRWALPALPAWAQVAAAALLIATAAAIANVQVRYDAAGLVVTTGWMTPAAVQPTAASNQQEEWRNALVAFEQTMRRELQAAREANATRTANAAPASNDGTAVLRRVEALLQENQRRESEDIAMRFAQFSRDYEYRRSADLSRIGQNLRQLEGRTFSQRDLQNLMRAVSTTQVP